MSNLLDWRSWSDTWSAVFPKNQMWSKIRSGDNDPDTGEPEYRFESKTDVSSVDPALGDVLAAHRLVMPASGDVQTCFAGDYEGPDHSAHLQQVVDDYLAS